MINVFYIILGSLSLALGVLGIILPVLPTTPFLLLTAYLYAKGSPRFYLWFTQTKLYDKHLRSFAETRSMTRGQKWRLMIFVDTMLVISFLLIESTAVKILIIVLVIIKYIYFFTQVKTIKV
ncbi:MAG: YbaN family protein [Bacillota bacterium]